MPIIQYSILGILSKFNQYESAYVELVLVYSFMSEKQDIHSKPIQNTINKNAKPITHTEPLKMQTKSQSNTKYFTKITLGAINVISFIPTIHTNTNACICIYVHPNEQRKLCLVITVGSSENIHRSSIIKPNLQRLDFFFLLG